MVNKILCKKDYCIYDDVDDSISFKKGILYDYVYYWRESTYEVFTNDNRVPKLFYNSDYTLKFEETFYTPEETLVILRKDKIDKLLNVNL